MSSVRQMMDEADIRYTNVARKLDQLTREMVKEVERWAPSQDRYQLAEYDVCSFRASSGSFSSSVEWSISSVKEVKSDSSRWYAGGGDVLVAERSLMGGDIGLIFPCRIQGTEAGQQERIPLQLRVGKVDSPKFSEDFHEGLAISLAKSMRDELKCVNHPKIPDGLTAAR